jgi:hypothetical protein
MAGLAHGPRQGLTGICSSVTSPCLDCTYLLLLLLPSAPACASQMAVTALGAAAGIDVTVNTLL